MVANHVLCQLSYTPDFRYQRSDTRCQRLESKSRIRPLASDIRPLSWLRGRDLNPRPLGYEPNELPDCSTPRQNLNHMVGLGRVELPTSRLSGVRSNQLSYRPITFLS